MFDVPVLLILPAGRFTETSITGFRLKTVTGNDAIVGDQRLDHTDHERNLLPPTEPFGHAP